MDLCIQSTREEDSIDSEACLQCDMTHSFANLSLQSNREAYSSDREACSQCDMTHSYVNLSLQSNREAHSSDREAYSNQPASSEIDPASADTGNVKKWVSVG